MNWEPIKNHELKYYCFNVVLHGRHFLAYDSSEIGAKLKAEFPHAEVKRLGHHVTTEADFWSCL